MLELDGSRLGGHPEVLREPQLIIFFDHLLHDGPRPTHELLEVEGIVLSLLLALDVADVVLVVPLVGDHDIVGGLVPLILAAQILCLHFLLHIL